MSDFAEQFAVLQESWRAHAIDRSLHFIPNLAPPHPVDYVLVAVMPNLSKREAEITPYGSYPPVIPYANMFIQVSDYILHYGAQHLCNSDRTYYVTDLAKGARPNGTVNYEIRNGDFEDWYPYLKEELDLVCKPTAKIIPVGTAVQHFLAKQSNFPKPLSEPVLHFSNIAIKHAMKASAIHCAEWEEFQEHTNLETLLNSARHTLTSHHLAEHIPEVVKRLEKANSLTDRDKHFMFTYKMQFTAIR